MIFFLNVWIFFFLFLSHFSSFLRCLHIYLHVLFHRHDLLFLSFPISPPLLHFITSSSTPSHHHHDLLFLLSSLLTLIPSTFLLFTLHRLFNSPPFSFSIFFHPHCHRHCCWNNLPNHVCLFYLVFFFFSFHVANFIKRGCKFISFVCLFVSGAISARIFYGLSLRWNIKIGLME